MRARLSVFVVLIALIGTVVAAQQGEVEKSKEKPKKNKVGKLEPDRIALGDNGKDQEAEAQAPKSDLDIIEITEPIVIQVNDSSSINLTAGLYKVSAVDSMMVIQDVGTQFVLVFPAVLLEHHQKIDGPLAFTDQGSDGSLHIVLLMPGDEGIQVTGFPDNPDQVRPRGTTIRTLSSTRINTLTTTKLQSPTTAYINPLTKEPGADFLPTTPDFSTLPYDTYSQKIRVKVKNIGTSSATAPSTSTRFEVSVLYRKKGTTSWQTFGGATSSTMGPPPGVTYTYDVQRQGGYPPPVLSQGVYEFNVRVDPRQLVSDVNRANNSKVYGHTIGIAPLAVKSVSRSSVLTGEPFTLSVASSSYYLKADPPIQVSIGGAEWVNAGSSTYNDAGTNMHQLKLSFPQAVSGTVSVRRGSVQAGSSVAMEVMGPPEITSVEPQEAYIGQTVTITGNNFVEWNGQPYASSKYRGTTVACNKYAGIWVPQGVTLTTHEKTRLSFVVPYPSATGDLKIESIAWPVRLEATTRLVVLPTVQFICLGSETFACDTPGGDTGALLFPGDWFDVMTQHTFAINEVKVGDIPCTLGPSTQYTNQAIRVYLPGKYDSFTRNEADLGGLQLGVQRVFVKKGEAVGSATVRIIRPTIESVSPQTVDRGSWVTLSGSDLWFKEMGSMWRVTVSHSPTRIPPQIDATSRSDTSLRIRIPEDFPVGTAWVQVWYRNSSNNVSFTVR